MCNNVTNVSSVPDPYENCYAVVRGTKTFVLLPPIEYYCIHGKTYFVHVFMNVMLLMLFFF